MKNGAPSFGAVEHQDSRDANDEWLKDTLAAHRAFAEDERSTMETPAPTLEKFDIEKITKWEMANFFFCSEESITDEEFATIKKRLQYMHYQLTEAILKEENLTGADAETKESIRNKADVLQLHDMMHAAVEYERNKKKGDNSCIPAFIRDTQHPNNEALIRDEIAALLFSIRVFVNMFIKIIKENPELSFQEVFSRYQSEAFKSATGSTYGTKKRALRKKILENPDPLTKARAERIYAGWKTGNKRVLMDEFLSMTAGMPEHVETISPKKAT